LANVEPGVRRPLLLASVRSAAEAQIAVAGGADIIDAKEPARGALGDVDRSEVTAIRAAVPAHISVSATIGDVACEDVASVLARTAVMATAGADIVKIGLFGPGDARALLDALAGFEPAFGRRFLVMLADRGVDLSLLGALQRAGFVGVMLDTADKSRGALPEQQDTDALARFVFTARQAGLRVGLAGALRLWHIEALVGLGPDILGFRGALCRDGVRAGEIDAAKVGDVARAVRAQAPRIAAARPGHVRDQQQEQHPRAVRRAPMTDLSILASRAVPRADEDSPRDRIFIRDWVLPIHIGVYPEEQNVTQQVGFTVEAEVAHSGAALHDEIAEVPSYDDILKTIRGIVEQGHINLVETLAERIAEACLADRRIHSVRVRIDKLERGPAAVGVEIVRPLKRERASDRVR
jgi:dihydroneopterin aldolase